MGAKILRSAATAALLLVAVHVHAVHLAANGIGQALIYPYYTVNAGQQTLLSVTNTTAVGKIVKVRFREAWNGRAVLDFNLYLAPTDAWSASVFALSDAGLAGDSPALLSRDTSCTDPVLRGVALPHGPSAQRFTNAHYTLASADSGPVTEARMREGHVEMILMSDVAPGSALAEVLAHPGTSAPDCDPALLASAAGAVAPTLDPDDGTPGTRADGGLFGAAAVIDVASGVLFAYSADALDGFSYRSLYSAPGDAEPTLASVNDRDDAQHATAHVIADDVAVSATFPGSDSGSRRIDAVSAVFAAASVFNEYAIANDGSAATDWVFTLPTKNFYVDAQPGGAIAGSTAAFAPFDGLFGAAAAGTSCIGTDVRSVRLFDREANGFTYECGFSSCPPIPVLCQQTGVVRFPGGDDALRSQLPAGFDPFVRLAEAGWIRWDLSYRALAPAANGDVFHGMPLTGFAATRYTNAFVPRPGGGVALGNYSGAWRHRTATACANAAGACR